jgi:hypothetical protein
MILERCVAGEDYDREWPNRYEVDKYTAWNMNMRCNFGQFSAWLYAQSERQMIKAHISRENKLNRKEEIIATAYS